MKIDAPLSMPCFAPPRARWSVVRRGARLLLLCAAASGCAEAEEGEWVETRHARIKGEYGVCAGLEAYVDERIELTADWFGLEPGPKIDISLGQSFVDEQQENYDYRIGGVAYRRNGEVSVFARADSLGHELVHAVRFSNGLVLPRLLDEGIAQLYDGGEFNGSGGGIGFMIPEDATLPDDPHDANVGVAATFVGWLHETLPREDFLRLINDPELDRANGAQSNWERIERTLGMTKEVLEARWRTEAEFYYSEVPRCRPERTYDLEVGDVLQIDDTISCADSPTTFGPYLEWDDEVYTAQRWHCFSLAEPVAVRVTASGPPGTQFALSPRFASCLTTSPLDEASETKRITIGETTEFTLGDCAWRTVLLSDPDTVGDISVTIELLE